jgi:hypothetical protein
MEQEIREMIRRELPRLIAEDPELYNWVWTIVHEHSFSRAETESRFDRVLDEIRQSREEWMRRWEENDARWRQQWEEDRRRWEENQRRWEENERRWEENQRRWEEDKRRWEENQRRWEEDKRRWEENQRRWEENERRWRQQWEEDRRRWEEDKRRWEENQQQIRALIEGLQRVDRRIDQTISALGARWGIMSEDAFRNALRGILEENFGVKVERVQYKDESGEVFGRPDQVELDVVIYNGQMLVCEIKASVSRGDVYIFERKVRSYEKRVGRKADRAILISPMIYEKDAELARTLGIEVYTSAEDVRPAG